jgi:signal transduction histidine kinase/ligand-binding sensor domain-containing protein/CheY-like chemotaxis protein/AraC-like DNA-binding protein
MKKIICLFVSLLASVATEAQTWPASFRFRHYTVENGLNSNSVRSLLQSRQGYLWFGTENGLNRFDGIRISDYSYDGAEHPGNRSINAMLEDQEGVIWLATDIGIFSFLPDTEQFRAFTVRANTGAVISSVVYGVVRDKDMNLWFATYGQGVFKYHAGSNELTHYEIPGCCNNIYGIYADSDNRIWATGNSAHSAAVYRLNRNTDAFEEFPLTYPRGGGYSNALSVYEDSSHNLWLGTWNAGLQKVDRYTGEVTAYLSPASGNGARHIHGINEYADQVLLVGSDDGLILLNTVTGEHKRFLPGETDPYSLSNRFVYPILKDREGGLWIGTYYGGVNYVSPRDGQFESFVHTRYANSVSGSVISRFSEDRRGNIWIGSDDGGLSCYQPGTGRFTHYLPKEGRNSLSYHNVHALCFDGDDLWIGTYSGGLNVLDTRTGRFRLYTSSQDGRTIDHNSIYAIFKDRNGNMWVTSMIGVNLYDRKTDSFIRLKEFGSVTMDIKQDTRGDLWFALQGKGVFRYSPGTQSWKNYLHDSSDAATLPGNMVNCIYTGTDGEVRIGTTDGLCIYNPHEDNFERVDLGTPNQNISCILREEGRRYWITTSKGLIRYVPGETCMVFSQTDGLQSDLFPAASGMKASDGKIYIGSVNGFNAFYPHRIRPNTFIPPVVLTGLEICNREIPVDMLPASLNRPDVLHLSCRDNVFAIRYAGLSYCIPEKNRYAYMLEGFDRKWNYVGAQHKATYTNLPAGSYVFRVKASNNDGIWNETGAKLAIVIHPPFYLTTGFKLLYLVLTGLAMALVFRFLMKRTEKKHSIEIEELNRRKEKEMHEAKIGFFTMIAHEIRTPVSLIIGPLEKIMTAGAAQIPDALRNDLHVIDRNSRRLLFLVNQLLDFRKIENGGFTPKYERCNMSELIKAVSIRFTPWVTQRGATFIVDCPDREATAVVDREALTKLISNLLTNAGKYTKDEVILSCRFAPDRETFSITVTDNGCGIKQEDRDKIFRPFYQSPDNKPGTGIGLSIVRNIVEAHAGKIEVRSEEDKGSAFIVTLPVEHAVTPYPDDAAEDTASGHLPEDILPASPAGGPVQVRPVMLIADDNDEMIRFLSASFADEYTIITAGDGEEALRKLKNAEVDLIVSDWMMPEISGVELCKAVRSNPMTSHIPFILLTAKTDIHSKIEGMECGADTYIEKPFSLQYLKSCIKNLIDLREMLYRKFSKMPLVPLKSIAGNQADERFLSCMNEIIEENFSNPDLSVDFLADRLCISRSGLFAKIKTLTNVTPNELIQVIRLKKAALLLAENRYRVNEICYMVGFNNPSYFSKCFRKQFGMKPNEFLKQGRKTGPNHAGQE